MAYIVQLDKNQKFVSVIGLYVSTGSRVTGTITATATQDGYVFVRVRTADAYSVLSLVDKYAKKSKILDLEQEILKTQSEIESSLTEQHDLTSSVERTLYVYNVDGTKNTSVDATVTGAAIVECLKGEEFTYTGTVGSSNAGESMAYIVQLDKNQKFVSVIGLYVSTGSRVTGTITATATQDGYVFVRVRTADAYSVLSLVDKYAKKSKILDLEQEILKTQSEIESSLTEQHDLTSSVERTLYVYNVDGTKNTSVDATVTGAAIVECLKGEEFTYTGTVGSSNAGESMAYIVQLDKNQKFVSVIGLYVSTGSRVTGTITATATQDGYVFVRVRTADAYSVLSRIRGSIQSLTDQIVLVSNRIDKKLLTQKDLALNVERASYLYNVDGTKNTSINATAWGSAIVECSEGNIFTLNGDLGSSNAGESMAYIVQLDKNQKFVSVIGLYVSTGSRVTGTITATATQDGYVFVRVRHERPFTLFGYVDKYANSENVLMKMPKVTSQLEKLPVKSSNGFGYNFVPYAQNNVVTVDNYQYVVVVDNNFLPIILQRYMQGSWIAYDLSKVADNVFKAPNARDSHNCFSIAVSKDGYLLITGNHHVNSCRAVISNQPHDISSFSSIKYTQSSQVTYPRLLRHKDGTVQAFWREGTSGDGVYCSALFNDETKTFEAKFTLINRAKTVTSNPYEQNIGIGADGSLHLCWGYRTDLMSANTNFGMFYAKSADKGKTWKNAANSIEYKLPLDDSNSEKIFDAAVGSGYCNQNGGCVDKNGNYHTVIWQYDENSNTQIVHIWFNGQNWMSEIVSDFAFKYDLSSNMVSGELSRPLIVCAQTGRLFVVYHTTKMGRENDVRAIDVTTQNHPIDFCLAKFNSNKVEYAINSDYAILDNEIVMLLSRGGGEQANDVWDNQSTYLLTAPLPIST
ncbi:hypothetical protein FOB28_08060 [Acinetobacter lwoffii]|nr:hypothetical protein [Acinetobacter lwoffii]